jgi:hypothetical protein
MVTKRAFSEGVSVMRFVTIAALAGASFAFAEELPFEITHPNYLSQVLPSDQLVGFLELTNPNFGVQQFPQLSVVEVQGRRVGYLSRNNPAQLIIWTTLVDAGPDPFLLPIRNPLTDAPASVAGGPVGSTDGGSTPGGGGGSTPGGGGSTPGGGTTDPGGGGGSTPGGGGGSTPGGGGGSTPGGGGGSTPGGGGGSTPGGGGGTDPGGGGGSGPGGGGTDPGPVALVPEPSSIGMMVLGAAAFLFAGRARSNRK